ncbi:hypothetical protein J5N97_022700 [Dioscorea zingiberensis]|uniref:Uncharacterized protein n=1 Tax=Dioscorea zingiberensis TaxID=325984 RepID=A0A9D5CAW2_9LILI|nr:hypothetical protein J5N97_022700 [Dioscorea zingiberensis]
MWVCQRVSHRGYWHSVHLQPCICIRGKGSGVKRDGGGHTANRSLLDSLCKTLVIIVVHICMSVLGSPKYVVCMSKGERKEHTIEAC